MKLAWYGDDFTGASDTLAVATQAGLRSMLFLNVPTPARLAAAGPLDALGIAGSTRTMAPQRMREELFPVRDFFQTLDARVFHYKCCSTFDSAAGTGSIGAAMHALRPVAASNVTYVVGGQPDIGRYCCFSNLFAAAGSGDEVFRLDRHPTMSAHPVTPMHESDLRRVLEGQGVAPIVSVHYPEYRLAESELDARVDGLSGVIDAGQAGALLFDVAEPAHLAAVGRQIWRRASEATLLTAGSSTVLQALAAHWDSVDAKQDARRGQPHRRGGKPETASRHDGPPVLALAGSMSPVTARQVARAMSYQPLALDARQLISDPAYPRAQANRAVAALEAGRHVLAYVRQSGTGPDHQVSSRDLARCTACLLADILSASARFGGLRRIGVAGGDTSSLAVKALDIWALSFVRAVSPGVALCRAHSDNPTLDGMEVMLKGGQMGPVDIFERLLVD
ncbi:MAG TPA: four-carbon acid sugar kinase family protein [Burkholderiaceae bacterium]|nr:four-carbon acid sugar kinase family protein [Burkholderiaceae bacterium]